ncbi:MAG TPA: hypothetical protein VMV74_01635 [Bacteroidales bacterium]|nr:hypothetical protein [Bacteroidales bacterium]
MAETLSDSTDKSLDDFFESQKDGLDKLNKGEEGAEEKPEETPEEKPEEKPEESPEEKPEEKPETPNEVEEFNKKYETNFESEETLKSSLKRLTELKDLDDLRTSKGELETKLKDLEKANQEVKESFNPKELFASEDEYKRQMILKHYGDAVNSEVLGKIVSGLEKVTDLETLALGQMLQTPGIDGGNEGALAVVLKKLGIESNDPEDWDQVTRNQIKIAAQAERKVMSKLVTDVDIPAWDSLDKVKEKQSEVNSQKLAESTQTWSGVIEKELGGLTEFDVKATNEKGEKETILSYGVDSDFKGAIKEAAVQFAVSQGMEPSRENLEKAIGFVQERFIVQNLTGMIQSAIKNTEAEVSERLKKEYDNPEEKHKDITPDSEAVTKEKEELNSWLREGTARSPGEPLF